MPYIWLAATVYCAFTDMHILNLLVFLVSIIWYPVTEYIARYEESKFSDIAWTIAFDEYGI